MWDDTFTASCVVLHHLEYYEWSEEILWSNLLYTEEQMNKHSIKNQVPVRNQKTGQKLQVFECP